jgi:hypothetical protein
MATTYTLIDKTTLGSSQTSITFSAIPSTFTDLLVRFSAKSDLSFGGGGQVVRIKPNNNNLSSGKWLSGNGSSVSSGNDDFAYSQPSDGGSDVFGNTDIYIPNYASSNSKSFSSDGVSENNATRADAGFMAGLWSSSAAITSIVLTPYYATNFVSGSSFYLYGIKNS